MLQVADGIFQLVDFVVLLCDETVKDVTVFQIVEVLVHDGFELGVSVLFGEELDPFLNVFLRHLLFADVLSHILETLIVPKVASNLILLSQKVAELLVVVEQPAVLTQLPLTLSLGLLQTLVQQVQLQSEFCPLLVVKSCFFVEFIQSCTHL